MKARTIGVLLVAAVLVCIAVGTASAFMIKRGGNSDASPAPTFGKADVACVVTKETTDEKTAVTVKNTGNVAAYIRVQIVVNWWDNSDLYYVSATDLDVSNMDGWVRDGNTFYYTHCVNVGEQTSLIVVDKPTTDVAKTDENGNDVKLTVYTLEVFAEAVQAEPTDAAEDLWKVVIDASGTIIPKATENS